MNRLLVAGTNSGCGKTTVTVALLAALKARGLDVASFKCGPDYIDPMFHRKALGINAHNLDPFFCEGEMLRSLFMSHAGKDISIIEGVMGYYDGIGVRGAASTYDVACAIESPVVLVVNAKGMSNSVAALLQGFARYREDSRIAGVIFNGLHEKNYPMMADIARTVGIKAYGFLPRKDDLSFDSRHLGLITADEIHDVEEKIAELGALAETNIDIDGLLALAGSAPVLDAPLLPAYFDEPYVRIAVARDEAFCFLYQENIELLESLGCEIVYFSPLEDSALPHDIAGLYLCGGYPELHAEALSKNVSMLRSVKESIEAGTPTIAECGGFMYLHEELAGFPMVGMVDAQAFETKRLQRFGYVTLTAQEDNLLCEKGASIRAHEFHYWNSADCGESFSAHLARRDEDYPCVHATESMYAGFPHIYLLANPRFAETYVRKVIRYANQYRTDQTG